MNTCVHVVAGYGWVVEALAGIGVAGLAVLLAVVLSELLWRWRHGRG
jgi:hypothetical protein